MSPVLTATDAVVPSHHPRVILETAAGLGADRDAVLEATDFTVAMLEAVDARLTYDQFGVLVGNAMRLTNNPGLGLDCGQRTHVSNLGVMGLALASSTSVGDALAAITGNMPTVAPSFQLSVVERGSVAVIQIRTVIPMVHRMFATEMLLAALYTQGRFLYGRALPLRNVNLSYPMPGHAGRYARELGDVPYAFDAPVTEVCFDASLLTCALRHSDPGTARLAESLHGRLSDASGTPGGRVAQVRDLLLDGSDPAMQLDHVARLLETTSRTLRRWLREEGTSFQQLKDEGREQRGIEWVTHSDLSFDDIARRLGFSDVRCFRRAFKRWTGSRPSDVRGEQRSLDGSG